MMMIPSEVAWDTRLREGDLFLLIYEASRINSIRLSGLTAISSEIYRCLKKQETNWFIVFESQMKWSHYSGNYRF